MEGDFDAIVKLNTFDSRQDQSILAGMNLLSYKTAILATGDEIVQGDTLNTNARDIAHELFVLGIPLGMRMCTTDDEADMVFAMDTLLKSHDILITIGGLGPTSDDRTRFALATYCKTELVEDATSLAHLIAKHNEHGIPTVDISKQQAMFPRGAIILRNPNGSACGCRYDFNGKRIYMLPGPPRECLPMFKDHVLPDYLTNLEGRETLLRWRVFGIAESILGDQVDKLLEHLPCLISYRWIYPYIDVKVRVTDLKFKDEITKKLDSALAPLIISPPTQTATEVLLDTLKNSKHPLTICDEATGGLLQAKLSNPDNISMLKFVTPGTEANIHVRGLTEFWTHHNPNLTTNVYLQFDHHPETTHTLPFRHERVREPVCEYVAHQISGYLKNRK